MNMFVTGFKIIFHFILTFWTWGMLARELLVRNDGDLVKEGDILVNRKLAATLRMLANGSVEEFYNGSLTDDIVRDIQDAGIMTNNLFELLNTDLIFKYFMFATQTYSILAGHVKKCNFHQRYGKGLECMNIC